MSWNISGAFSEQPYPFLHIVFSASTYRRASHFWSRGNAHDVYSEGTRSNITRDTEYPEILRGFPQSLSIFWDLTYMQLGTWLFVEFSFFPFPVVFFLGSFEVLQVYHMSEPCRFWRMQRLIRSLDPLRNRSVANWVASSNVASPWTCGLGIFAPRLGDLTGVCIAFQRRHSENVVWPWLLPSESLPT
jgi:hypothetical protein